MINAVEEFVNDPLLMGMDDEQDPGNAEQREFWDNRLQQLRGELVRREEIAAESNATGEARGTSSTIDTQSGNSLDDGVDPQPSPGGDYSSDRGEGTYTGNGKGK